MGTVNSGIGLVSGLNIQQIVTQLMSIERRPSDLVQARLNQNTQIQKALQNLTVKLNTANLSAAQLAAGQSFTQRTATASSDAVIVSAGRGATLGSLSVTPRTLASTSQLLSSGFSSASSLVGEGVIKIRQGGFVDADTRLSTLNGGAGVRAGSIRLTDAAGSASVVDLTGAVTIRQVVDAINSASGSNVTASVSGGALRLTDNSGGGGAVQVQEIAGGSTAADLGLTSLSQNGNQFTGQTIARLASGMDLRQLNDGNGVRNVQGLDDFSVAAGALSFNVKIDGARTLGDVVNLINSNATNGGRVVASIDGRRLRLQDTNGSPEDIVVTVLNDSGAAEDLGFVSGSSTGSNATGVGGDLNGAAIVANLGTVLLRSLRGGTDQSSTTTTGEININGAAIDLSAATTLQDVVDGINAAGVSGVTASINAARNGVLISGGGPLTISDTTGNLASRLNISGSFASGSVNSGDLSLQTISSSTRLASLNAGVGVPKGTFRLIDGNGAAATIDLSQNFDYSVGDVIRTINTRGLAVSARINDTGDGILLERTGGTGNIQVLELNNGTVASSLRLKTASDGAATVDGSYTTSVTVSATDKLSDVLTKIQQAGAPIQANLINDGSSLNPFRLNLTSRQSGLAGELLIDGGQTGLTFTTVNKARDAVVLFGSSEAGATPVQLVSGSNSFSNIAPGLTVNVSRTSSTPITVTVSQNQKSVIDAVQKLVDGINDARSYISDNSTFDATTGSRGLFFTDATVRLASQRIIGFVNGVFNDTGSTLRSLGQIGVTLGDDGTVEFDSSVLQAAIDADPTNVERFFTAASTGLAARFADLTKELSDPVNGTLTGRENAVQLQIDSQNRTIDRLGTLLSQKEKRLYSQFYAMEAALSKLQTQQTALTQLATLAQSLSSTTF